MVSRRSTSWNKSEDASLNTKLDFKDTRNWTLVKNKKKIILLSFLRNKYVFFSYFFFVDALLSSNTDSMEVQNFFKKICQFLRLWDLGLATVSLAFNFRYIGKLSFLNLETLGSLLLFYSVHLICNIIRGPRCDWISILKNFSCGFISTAAVDSNFLFINSTVDFIFVSARFFLLEYEKCC
ncbi:hypothetical protein C1646_669905 [Rhizophagus diaphanus]|nr:hypothetical protein C1646_669905 [Rhizophagus diaphanus] [Rhizophagus sp. MUCL 43196]